MNDDHTLPEPFDAGETLALPDRRAAIAHHMAALEELADPASRTDGWTPFARKLFLQVVAESGRVSAACQYAGLSKQSAYALRARDPLFAAGWDAACELARRPLADALYEQAVDGITDTITREDGRTITRHRLDSRLSIAVLNRLDRRCDRAAEMGSRHLGAIGRWDEFVAAIGSDDPAVARAILDTAQAARAEIANVSQPSQLRANPDEEEEEIDLPDPRIWWEPARSAYRTNFPPPDGSDCHEHEQFGHRDYHRALTDAEAATMAARDDASAAARRAADEAERDAFFAALRDGEGKEEQEQEVPLPSASADTSPGTGGGTETSSPSPSSGGGVPKGRRGGSRIKPPPPPT